MTNCHHAGTGSPERPLTPGLRGGTRSELLVRIRELARIAAAADGLVTGAAPCGSHIRLATRRSDAILDAGDLSADPAGNVELLLAELPRHGVALVRRQELEGAAREQALAAFRRELYLTITPLTLDEVHPLPRARVRGMLVVGTLAAVGRCRSRDQFTLVALPGAGGRWIQLDPRPGSIRFAPAEELVRIGLAAMFGNELTACHVLRVVRPVKELVSSAPSGHVEHEPGVPAHLLERLREELRLEPKRPRATTGLLGLADLAALCDAIDGR